MLSAAERVVLGKATAGGFISERDLNHSQTRTAENLIARKLLTVSGKETDGTKVYGITGLGRQAYGARL